MPRNSLAAPAFLADIEAAADYQVSLFLMGEEKDQRTTEQIKNVIEGIISADYRGRTVIELIQNAHDAHPKDRSDGRIIVMLDETEGDHGVLYVANGGRPLSKLNFEAMVNVAISSKPPNDGIGNKGVGFKSVLHFSDCPEVYSRSRAGSPAFDGYTFRFGRDDDWETLAHRVAPSDESLADRLRPAVSGLTVTVPLVELPSHVDRWLGEEICTVIRLPLRSESAASDALGEVRAVLRGDAPMHLFLERIASIEIVVIGDEGAVTERLSREVRVVDAEVGVSSLRLQDGTEFLLARRGVPEAAVKAAIRATVAAGAQLPGWDRWEGAAEVVIAVSVRDPLEQPHIYNFLPMGDQLRSPLAAHLQAPFFSSLDRRQLDDSLPINAMFLQEAAKLAASLLVAADEGSWSAPDGALVDLACWTPNHLHRLEEALTASDRCVSKLAFLPSLSDANVRTHPSAARYWASEGDWFTSSALADVDRANLINDGLGAGRLAKLEDLFDCLGDEVRFRPTAPELVTFAERCAAAMLASATGADWADFYDELADGLPNGAPVEGRLLVVGRRRMLPANDPKADGKVFFPPRRKRGEVRAEPPAAVEALLSYVRGDIPWNFEGETAHRPGRKWLEGPVAEFRSEEILEVVASAMSDDALADHDRLVCLLYAFDIWRGARSPLGDEAFPGEPFLVPVAAGWMPADQTYFGIGWGGEAEWVDEGLGRLLAAEGDVDDFSDIADAVIRQPEVWVPVELAEEMRVFLEHAGANHGLWPFDVDTGGLELPGWQLEAPQSVNRSLLPETIPPAAQAEWLAIARQDAGSAPYSTVDYRLESLQRLPGQYDWERLGETSRRAYAELVLFGLGHWDDAWLQASFHREVSSVRTYWPSLITSFLRTVKWFPQTTPGDRGDVRLVAAKDGWWVTDSVPEWLPGPSTHLRRVVPDSTIGRLRALGVRHWDAPDGAAERLNLIMGSIDEARTWVRGLRAEYERSWTAVLGAPDGPQPIGVLVERQGTVVRTDGGEPNDVIYFADPDTPQSGLLSQLPVWRLAIQDRSLARRVGEHLADRLGEHFKSVADADIHVTWSDPVQEGNLPQMLGEWFETVTVLVLGRQQGFGSSRGRQLEEAARTLRSARVVVVENFATSIDGHVIDAPYNQTSCWTEADGVDIIVVRNMPGMGQLRLAERAAEGVSQAIGSPRISSDLRVALLDLQGVAAGTGSPGATEIANALGIPESDVRIVGEEQGSWHPDRTALVEVLATVAPAAAEELRDGDSVPDARDELRQWIATRVPADGWYVDQLLAFADQARPSGPVADDLVDLHTANSGLALLGIDPLSNATEHQRQFQAYMRKHRGDILNGLRDRFVTRLQESETARTRYSELLSSPDVTVDPTWAGEYWLVPETAMAARIAEWLDEAAGPLTEDFRLPPVLELRERQKRSLATILSRARDNIFAWCALHEVDSPTAIDVQIVAARIREGGYQDFHELSRDEVLTLLAGWGLWPIGMPVSLNQKKLGITTEDQRRFREQRAREREAERKRSASVTFGDEVFTADPDDLLKLTVSLLDDYVDDGVVGVPMVAALTPPSSELRPSQGKGKQEGPEARQSFRATSPADDKAELIGFAGEVIAGEYLHRRFGLRKEETWCSGYRESELGDEKGNDALGYDFEVETAECTYLVEVKATTGTATRFSLTNTEVRRALSVAPHERYMVLFITEVLDAERRKLYWLPNPTGEHAELYGVVGQDITYTFRVDP